MKQHDTAVVQAKLWNARYESIGYLWGTEPSYSASLLTAALDKLYQNAFKVRNIITVGAGYGRDEIHLASRGAEITAYELAKNGIALGKTLAKENGVFERIKWRRFDFSKSKNTIKYDGFLSHRTLHLLDDKQVPGFIEQMSNCVNDGAPVVISARNKADFDEDKMVWVSEKEGIAQYKDPDKEGHILHFWDEAKFRKHFTDSLDLDNGHHAFMSSTEMDASDSERLTKFTVMVAFKRASSNNVSKNSPSQGNENSLVNGRHKERASGSLLEVGAHSFGVMSPHRLSLI